MPIGLKRSSSAASLLGRPGLTATPHGVSSKDRAVPMSVEVLLTSTSSLVVRHRNESRDQFLRRLTHLQLQNQRFAAFGNLHLVPNVQVLYAYENRISSLSGLEHIRGLQQLYLQNNRVQSMSGLEDLPHLRTLHLDHNQIQRVECLEMCRNLEALHVSYQRIDGPLEFCPTSVAQIAPTLRVLEVAGDQLATLSALLPLEGLQRFDASANLISSVPDIRELFEKNRQLSHVRLAGNPLATNERKYRAIVCLLCDAVEEIDEKKVLQGERDFVRRLEAQKLRAQKVGAVKEPVDGVKLPKWPKMMGPIARGVF